MNKPQRLTVSIAIAVLCLASVGCETLPVPEGPKEYLRTTVAGLIGVPYKSQQGSSGGSHSSSGFGISRPAGHMPDSVPARPEPPDTSNTLEAQQRERRIAEIVARRQAPRNSEFQVASRELQSVQDASGPTSTPAELPASSPPPASPLSVSPLPELPPQDPYARSEEALSRLIAMYRGFQYIQVLQESAALVREPQLKPAHRALAYILAGSSAYVLGNEAVMREFLAQAVTADPTYHPSPEYFPTAVCSAHAALSNKTE